MQTFFMCFFAFCFVTCNALVMVRFTRQGWLQWHATQWRAIKASRKMFLTYIATTLFFTMGPLLMGWGHLALLMITLIIIEMLFRTISESVIPAETL